VSLPLGARSKRSRPASHPQHPFKSPTAHAQPDTYRGAIFEWRDGYQINGTPRQRHWLTHLQDVARCYAKPEVLDYALADANTLVLKLRVEGPAVARGGGGGGGGGHVGDGAPVDDRRR